MQSDARTRSTPVPIVFSIEVGTSAKPIPATSDDPNWSYEDDAATVQRWLSRLYPDLDRFSHKLPYGISFKDIATRMTWVMDYGSPSAGRGGASAEDDPLFYVYPSRELYHETLSPNGKIRITLTRFKIRIWQLIEAMEQESGVTEVAAETREGGFIAHELAHAAQFMTRPIRNFENHQDMVVDGIVPSALMRDIWNKANSYEPEGFYIQMLHEQGLTASIKAFNDRIDQYRAKHPDFFLPGGKFQQVAKYRMGLTDAAVELDLSLGSIRAKRWIDPYYFRLMNGLFLPAAIVREFVQLEQNACQAGVKPEMEIQVSGLMDSWNSLFADPESLEFMKVRHTYLFDRGVVSRYTELLSSWNFIKKNDPSKCADSLAVDLLN